jgi:hypothetical protein
VFGDSVRSASLMGGTVIVLAVAANLLLSGNQGDTNAATH